MAKQLIINGVAVVAPSSFSVGIQDIDGESGRNANGTMVRDRIARKRKLDCEWGMLTDAEISQLLNAVEPEFFDVVYPDPMLGGQATITADVLILISGHIRLVNSLRLAQQRQVSLNLRYLVL